MGEQATMVQQNSAGTNNQCPENPAERSGGIMSVKCPECSTKVGISLACCANIESIIAHPQSREHTIDRAAINRPREHQIQCANAHTISILYGW